ncbi:hypothetical protein ACSNOI_21955 [Actinomadura kijaniata]|uniref:hypothetical protein n=1 Tax=Actinomadura kijaniata TaxID=46161 RepID=UPI003F19AFA9
MTALERQAALAVRKTRAGKLVSDEVERVVEITRAFPYSIPDEATAAHLHEDSWAFGETVRLPEPLDFEINTGLWEPWE